MKTKNPVYIILTVIAGLSFLSYAFMSGLYYLDGLSYYKYVQWDTIQTAIIWAAVSIVILLIVIALGVFLFSSSDKIRRYKPFVAIFTVLIACVLSFAAFIHMAALVLGTTGYSYTEDINNYGKYDEVVKTPTYFPTEITDDMQVIDFCYYYRYFDIGQTDIYLEVKFKDEETMTRYLEDAKTSLGDKIQTYQNPFDPSYTDCVKDNCSVLSSGEQFSVVIEFCQSDTSDYKYTEVSYNVVTYSYEDLTIIYNRTGIGSDIEIKEHYPKIFKRFNVEHNEKNNFSYLSTEE